MKVLLLLFCLASQSPIKPDRNSAQANGASEQKTASAGAAHDDKRADLRGDDVKEAPEWYGSVEWANWALVIIGGITAYAVWKQAKETASATQAMRESTPVSKQAAEAATRSADAQVNAERPWISARIVKRIENIEKSIGGMHVTHPITYFDFILTNHGRTPALIVSVEALNRVSGSVDGEFNETAEPDYGLPSVLKHIRLLAPNEKWIYESWTPLTTPAMITDERAEVVAGTKHIIYWGVVRYADQFTPDKLHETRFCYTYLKHLEEYRPSGPRQHTRYT